MRYYNNLNIRYWLVVSVCPNSSDDAILMSTSDIDSTLTITNSGEDNPLTSPSIKKNFFKKNIEDGMNR